MAVIAVTHDVAQVYDADINQPTVNLECSVVGFHVYIEITRGGVILGDWKIIDGAPPVVINLIRHDNVVILLPCGTGTMNVTRL